MVLAIPVLGLNIYRYQQQSARSGSGGDVPAFTPRELRDRLRLLARGLLEYKKMRRCKDRLALD